MLLEQHKQQTEQLSPRCFASENVLSHAFDVGSLATNVDRTLLIRNELKVVNPLLLQLQAEFGRLLSRLVEGFVRKLKLLVGVSELC